MEYRQDLLHLPGIKGKGSSVVCICIAKIRVRMVHDQVVDGAVYIPQRHTVNMG